MSKLCQKFYLSFSEHCDIVKNSVSECYVAVYPKKIIICNIGNFAKGEDMETILHGKMIILNVNEDFLWFCEALKTIVDMSILGDYSCKILFKDDLDFHIRINMENHPFLSLTSGDESVTSIFACANLCEVQDFCQILAKSIPFALCPHETTRDLLFKFTKKVLGNNNSIMEILDLMNIWKNFDLSGESNAQAQETDREKQIEKLCVIFGSDKSAQMSIFNGFLNANQKVLWATFHLHALSGKHDNLPYVILQRNDDGENNCENDIESADNDGKRLNERILQ